jgi:hypothetical protein
MAKLFRMYIGHLYINFQIGVNIIGLPEFHTHGIIISKQIKETDLHKYQ